MSSGWRQATGLRYKLRSGALRPLSEVGPPTRFTIAREAEPREADEHQRPGRWFWSSDDEREVLD